MQIDFYETSVIELQRLFPRLKRYNIRAEYKEGRYHRKPEWHEVGEDLSRAEVIATGKQKYPNAKIVANPVLPSKMDYYREYARHFKINEGEEIDHFATIARKRALDLYRLSQTIGERSKNGNIVPLKYF